MNSVQADSRPVSPQITFDREVESRSPVSFDSSSSEEYTEKIETFLQHCRLRLEYSRHRESAEKRTFQVCHQAMKFFEANFHLLSEIQADRMLREIYWFGQISIFVKKEPIEQVKESSEPKVRRIFFTFNLWANVETTLQANLKASLMTRIRTALVSITCTLPSSSRDAVQASIEQAIVADIEKALQVKNQDNLRGIIKAALHGHVDESKQSEIETALLTNIQQAFEKFTQLAGDVVDQPLLKHYRKTAMRSLAHRLIRISRKDEEIVPSIAREFGIDNEGYDLLREEVIHIINLRNSSVKVVCDYLKILWCVKNPLKTSKEEEKTFLLETAMYMFPRLHCRETALKLLREVTTDGLISESQRCLLLDLPLEKSAFRQILGLAKCVFESNTSIASYTLRLLVESVFRDLHTLTKEDVGEVLALLSKHKGGLYSSDTVYRTQVVQLFVEVFGCFNENSNWSDDDKYDFCRFMIERAGMETLWLSFIGDIAKKNRLSPQKYETLSWLYHAIEWSIYPEDALGSVQVMQMQWATKVLSSMKQLTLEDVNWLKKVQEEAYGGSKPSFMRMWIQTSNRVDLMPRERFDLLLWIYNSNTCSAKEIIDLHLLSVNNLQGRITAPVLADWVSLITKTDQDLGRQADLKESWILLLRTLVSRNLFIDDLKNALSLHLLDCKEAFDDNLELPFQRARTALAIAEDHFGLQRDELCQPVRKSEAIAWAFAMRSIWRMTIDLQRTEAERYPYLILRHYLIDRVKKAFSNLDRKDAEYSVAYDCLIGLEEDGFWVKDKVNGKEMDVSVYNWPVGEGWTLSLKRFRHQKEKCWAVMIRRGDGIVIMVDEENLETGYRILAPIQSSTDPASLPQ